MNFQGRTLGMPVMNADRAWIEWGWRLGIIRAWNFRSSWPQAAAHQSFLFGGGVW